MLGGEGRKDAFLVTGTARVRDVVELFIELNGGLGCAILEASQAAGINVQHLGDESHVASGVAECPPDPHPRCVGQELSMSGAHWSRRCQGTGVGFMPLQIDSR